jgi:hypothetical protein
MKRKISICIILILASVLWSIEASAQVTIPTNTYAPTPPPYVGWNSNNTLDFKLNPSGTF